MKRYMAVNGGSATYLSRIEQIEEYREKGCSIYELDGNDMTLIAAPGKLLSRKIELGKKVTGGLRNGG